MQKIFPFRGTDFRALTPGETAAIIRGKRRPSGQRQRTAARCPRKGR
uniref:Uncharacterized protein n=1 Tax=Caudovirales sp. ctu3532 TaxID=2827639 RepID=A0A8S5TIW2_9CAUD|nr:MAG TPA: hypothetical protein [Caudovirales sp. ctu3532]